MTDEEQKEIREACEAIGEVNVTPNATGKIDVNEWLKLLGVSVKLQVRFLARIEEKHRHERRSAMNEENQQKFAQSCMIMLNEQGKCKQQVMLAIFDHFSIEPEVFEKTGAEVRQVPASLELMK